MLCDCKNHAWKPLNRAFATIVSPADDRLLMEFNWYVSLDSRGYASVRRNLPRAPGKRGQVKLSRELVSHNGSLFVDHIDGDPLNNQRENLRVCLPGENNLNAKPRRGKNVPLKGVRLSSGGKFQSVITHGRKQRYLGTFSTAEAAHEAYCEAARKLHGKFARLS